jgi:hypothetical protein
MLMVTTILEKLMTGWLHAYLSLQTWIPSQMGQHKVRLPWGEHHCKVEEDGLVKLDETFTLHGDAAQRKTLMAGRTFEETVEDPSRRSQFSFEGGRSACTFLAVEAAAHLRKRLLRADAGSCVVPEDIQAVLDRGMQRYLEEGGKDSLEAMGLEHANVAEVTQNAHSIPFFPCIFLLRLISSAYHWHLSSLCLSFIRFIGFGRYQRCVGSWFDVAAHRGNHQQHLQHMALPLLKDICSIHESPTPHRTTGSRIFPSIRQQVVNGPRPDILGQSTGSNKCRGCARATVTPRTPGTRRCVCMPDAASREHSHSLFPGGGSVRRARHAHEVHRAGQGSCSLL